MDRNHSFDVIAGLLMIHVVFLHASSMVFGPDLTTVWMIYPKLTFFAMPWFFFKSGMYYKPWGGNKSLVKKLLVPYIFFIFISFFEWCIFRKGFAFNECLDLFVEKGEIPGNFALWFMATFIIVKMFVTVVDIRKMAVVLLLSCFILAFALNQLDFDIPIYCENIFLGLFYFILGYLYVKTKEIEVCFRGKCLPVKYLWISGSVAIMIGYLFSPSWVEMPGNVVVYGDYMMGLFGAGAAIIIVNYLFFYVGRIPILEWIGRNSLVILGTHLNILLGGKLLAIKLSSDTNVQCIIMILLLIIFMPIVISILSNPRLSFLGFYHG